MNTLIVHAHPEPRSFNRALTDVAVEVLSGSGAVQVSDLYALRFKAVADVEDFGEREDPEFFRLDREQTHAHERAATAADIRAEQQKLAWADLVILQFPMWWFGLPAIMKGWADRVFTRGFAYLPGRKYDTGLMRGKRAMLSVTTGTSADTYAPDGIDGALLDILWPVHNGLLRYCGFDVLAPYVTYMPRRLTADERRAALDGYRVHLARLDRADQLFFHPAADYGDNERLLPHVVVGSGFQHR